MTYQKQSGFSLAEILVTLALLGLLATFTIPKVLGVFIDNGDTSRRSVQAAASMIQGAYMQYRQENNPSGETRFGDFTPYMNYVKVLTAGDIDQDKDSSGVTSCIPTAPCLVMQNGAIIRYWQGSGASSSGNEFGGTSQNRYLNIQIDPDGEAKDATANSDNPTKSVRVLLYYDGKIKDAAMCATGDLTTNNDVDANWCPGNLITQRPTWFNWDSN